MVFQQMVEIKDIFMLTVMFLLTMRMYVRVLSSERKFACHRSVFLSEGTCAFYCAKARVRFIVRMHVRVFSSQSRRTP